MEKGVLDIPGNLSKIIRLSFFWACIFLLVEMKYRQSTAWHGWIGARANDLGAGPSFSLWTPSPNDLWFQFSPCKL